MSDHGRSRVVRVGRCFQRSAAGWRKADAGEGAEQPDRPRPFFKRVDCVGSSNLHGRTSSLLACCPIFLNEDAAARGHRRQGDGEGRPTESRCRRAGRRRRALELAGHRSQRDRSDPHRGGDPKRVARGLLEAECFRSARKHSTRRWSSRRRTWTMPVANRRSSTGRALKASRQRRPGADGRAQGTAGPSIEHHRWWRQKVGRPDVDSGHGVIRRPSRPSVSRHHTARAIARRMASAQPGGFGLMGCTARGGRPARLARLPGADQSQHRRSLETPGAPLRPVAAWAVRVRSAAIPAPARPIGSSCRRRRSSPGRPGR